MKLFEKELLSVRIPKKLNKTLIKLVAAKEISKTAFILTLIDKEISKKSDNKSTTT